MSINEQLLKRKAMLEVAISNNKAVVSMASTELISNKRELEEVEARIKASIREICDKDAPNSGKSWTRFDLDHLADRLQDFLFDEATKLGRSTLSIRYKVAEEILPHLANKTCAFCPACPTKK